MARTELEISWISLWRVLFFVILLSLLYSGRRILLGLFLAIVISFGLDFLVDFLEQRGIPRTLGVIFIFLGSALLIIITVYTLIPLILVDLNTAFSSLNALTRDLGMGPLIDFRVAQSFNALINNISKQFFGGETSPLGALAQIVGGVTLAFSVIVSSFYLSLSRDGVERFIRDIFPSHYEKAALTIFDRARKRIGDWFRTQLLVSLIMGVLVLVALLLLGVKHALLVAVLAAMFELVPFIGPILSGSVAVILALTVSQTLAIATLVVFLAIHQFESHLLVPLLMSRRVSLHPVIVITALLIGAEAAGFLGILISVPAVVLLQEIVEYWSGKHESREAAVV